VGIEAKARNFLSWITPDKDDRSELKQLRDRVRKNIKAKAEADGLIITSTPNSGSFSTHTGLKRFNMGNANVDGQDIDLPFIVKEQNSDGDKLNYLLTKFEKYCSQAYPNTKTNPTKSSIELSFLNDKVKFDIVPFLDLQNSENQLLIRSNGEERETNIEKHKLFIKSRTASSKSAQGVVTYNNCVRLVKWWREHQMIQKDNSPDMISEIPSFLLNLLCAKAYDIHGVKEGYLETIAAWFGQMGKFAKEKTLIYFTDYDSVTIPFVEDNEWNVLDPVNFQNNAADKISQYEASSLGDWFYEAHDKLNQIIVNDMRGKDTEALNLCVDLFGNTFRNHC
jgi:hypothetical protein